MPQSTNLNSSPYYDDYSEESNYYKVLFKPGVTVQTRELNNLQSILQSQIEKFGSKFFTNGGIVIPGNFAYDSKFSCIEIESTYKSIFVEDYFESFVGKSIRGKDTGIVAKVEYVLSKNDPQSFRKTTCLYIKYQTSSSQDFSTSVFNDGEDLLAAEEVVFGTTVFSVDTPAFKVLSPTDRKASSVGSAAKIEDGIYFIRGTFVNIYKNTIILDPYTNTPSYRVGLKVTETIVDSDEDITLVDNAKGFSNYAAPGADRLKIDVELIKKDLEDYNDDNFIELFRVQNGILRKIKKYDPYSFITEVLARRTYDESGHYYVQPFNVDALESLNDNLGNGGQFFDGQKTFENATPSKDLAAIKISPGKAYVKGYEIATSTEILDYPKPRTTKNVESSASNFYAANLLKVNNLTGLPTLGISNDSTVKLYSTRLGSDNLPTAGDEIGVARVYDFEYHNSSYVDDSSVGNLYLFDIQTYTKITTNVEINGIAIGSYIKGRNSNASGYVKSFSGTNITLYQVSGNFIQDELLSISGVNTIQSVSTVRDYSIQDIKSISNNSQSFTADSVLGKNITLSNQTNITVTGAGATIATGNGASFLNPVKINDVISYIVPNQTVPTYAKVLTVSPNYNSIDVIQLPASVTNVCTNNLGATGTLSNVNILRSELDNYDDSSLYAKLENEGISEVSFLNSQIYVKKDYTVTITGSSVTLPSLDNTDFIYPAFDEERYCLVTGLGTHVPINENNVSLNSGNKSGSLTSLSVASANDCKLIVSLIKSNISSKYKKLERCSSLLIDKSKYNSTGLTLSSIYGTRVEDQEISLNRPDIFEVHGIFQSASSADPQLPAITLSGINLQNIVVGEVLVGKTSGAVAICVQKVSESNITIVYKNSSIFTYGEIINFKESLVEATVLTVTPGDQNILSDYIVDNGQRKHFYDFGRIIRKDISREVSKKIKVVFDYFKFESTDAGDIISVNSYPSNLYSNKIPTFNGVRNTDSIDIRPRVSDYNISSTLSPFEYGSRIFTSGSNTAAQILKTNESIVFDYKFYLPRTDKLVLNSEGDFSLIFGDPSENPLEPKVSEEVLDVATIIGHPYVFDVDTDIEIKLMDHKRYTMSSIRDIEQRVENLEYYTSLSLLEVSTQNLLIKDSEGYPQFKSGFFVDNFSSYDVSDEEDKLFNADISNNCLTANVDRSEITLGISTSNNIRTTGNIITLDYSENEYSKQPFASRPVNINPFNLITWQGSISLEPESDKWVEKIKRKTSNENEEKKKVKKIKAIRSRNIKFNALRFKPSTQFDFIFDSKNLSDNSLGTTLAFPKLIEIQNVNGTFLAGETVEGYDPSNKLNKITFRLSTANHKEGPFNSPTTVYVLNPYSGTALPSVYGPESTVLNVDLDTLERKKESEFFGVITSGMKLEGKTSNATATVSQIRLVTDEFGQLYGSFFIPNPKKSSIKFTTGNTTASLQLSNTSSIPIGEAVSSGETNFVSEGKKVVISKVKNIDPLAQTFQVTEQSGIFVSSVDIFFSSKDNILPVELQIREVISGLPGGSEKVVTNLSKVLPPNKINISADGSASTTFTFDSPGKLEGNREYAIVLLSDSTNYNIWVSRINEFEISTQNLPESQKVVINKQPSVGSLFKSQNGSTWVSIPEEDLKYVVKKTVFNTEGGTVFLTNNVIAPKSIQNKLPDNPIVGLSSSADAPYNDGRHIKVTHPNHGMYSSNNKVTLYGIEPDELPVSITSEYLNTNNGSISIAAGSESNFIMFNGIPVDTANPGYIKIEEEILKYTGTNSGQLTGITRGQLGTIVTTHPVNSNVYKYQFNGISLTRINKTFDYIIDPTINSYYVQIDDDTIFETIKSGGGETAYATKNIQFSSLEIDDDFITNYPTTSVSASIRTVSSTSVDGNEVSFIDNGYSSIGINTINKFTTPRMICSRENEEQFLSESQFVDKKSFSLELNLSTTDANTSPVINLQYLNLFADNYEINQPIDLSSYENDPRVNSLDNDPHSFVYITKKIDLLNSSTSLKVLLSAYNSQYSDIRVLYKIFRNDVPDEDQNWELFPGRLGLNDGSSDNFVPPSLFGQFLEYEYTANNLPPFTSYAIKILGTSSNQAYTPIVKNLRVIALK